MLAVAQGSNVPARRRADHPGRRRARRSTRCSCGCIRPRAACASSPTETPAELMAFDLLELGGKSLRGRAARASAAQALESFFTRRTRPRRLHLSPVTSDRATALGLARAQRRRARRRRSPSALDLEYRPGERAMVKVKQQRTADCVVGGFRYAEKKQAGRLAAARPLRRRGPAQPCRLHLGDPGGGTAGADQEARSAGRRRPASPAMRPAGQPLEHRAHRSNGSR